MGRKLQKKATPLRTLSSAPKSTARKRLDARYNELGEIQKMLESTPLPLEEAEARAASQEFRAVGLQVVALLYSPEGTGRSAEKNGRSNEPYNRFLQLLLYLSEVSPVQLSKSGGGTICLPELQKGLRAHFNAIYSDVENSEWQAVFAGQPVTAKAFLQRFEAVATAIVKQGRGMWPVKPRGLKRLWSQGGQSSRHWTRRGSHLPSWFSACSKTVTTTDTGGSGDCLASVIHRDSHGFALSTGSQNMGEAPSKLDSDRSRTHDGRSSTSRIPSPIFPSDSRAGLVIQDVSTILPKLDEELFTKVALTLNNPHEMRSSIISGSRRDSSELSSVNSIMQSSHGSDPTESDIRASTAATTSIPSRSSGGKRTVTAQETLNARDRGLESIEEVKHVRIAAHQKKMQTRMNGSPKIFKRLE